MPGLDNFILAVVTMHPEQVLGSTVFIVTDQTQMQTLANSLAHILDGMVHDVGNDTLIVVRH